MSLATIYTIQLSLTGTPDVACAGLACVRVHHLDELRRETAVELHVLPRDYKFKLCGEFTSMGTCKRGIRCCDAHGVRDLRCVLNLQSAF